MHVHLVPFDTLNCPEPLSVSLKRYMEDCTLLRPTIFGRALDLGSLCSGVEYRNRIGIEVTRVQGLAAWHVPTQICFGGTRARSQL